MSLATICAVPYKAMAAFLAGDDAGRLASIARAHDRVWIISVTSAPTCPVNAFEGWSDDGPAPLVVDGDDRLALVFDDVIPPDDGARRAEYVYFDEAMAARVVAFVTRAHAEDPARRDALLVNCHAGISRSGAIADFARVVAGVPYDDFRRANPQVVPNTWVRRTLLEVWARDDG